MSELINLAISLAPLLEKILALRQANPAVSPEYLRAELTKDADALNQKIQDDLDAHPPAA